MMLVAIKPAMPEMTFINGQCVMVREVVMNTKSFVIGNDDGEYEIKMKGKDVSINGQVCRIRPRKG